MLSSKIKSVAFSKADIRSSGSLSIVIAVIVETISISLDKIDLRRRLSLVNSSGGIFVMCYEVCFIIFWATRWFEMCLRKIMRVLFPFNVLVIAIFFVWSASSSYFSEHMSLLVESKVSDTMKGLSVNYTLNLFTQISKDSWVVLVKRSSFMREYIDHLIRKRSITWKVRGSIDNDRIINNKRNVIALTNDVE